MAKTKQDKINKLLIFLVLIVFPFGQILSIESPFGLRIHLFDIVILVSGGWFYFVNLKNPKYPKYFRKLFFLWIVLSFTLFFSSIFFNWDSILIGFLYLIRFLYLTYFSIVIWKCFKTQKSKELISNSLLAVGIFVAIFGLFQYFTYPDLTSLKEFGWDDHLYRLVSTFLDPAYTGIILVLSFILGLQKFIASKKLSIFLLLAVLLTAIGLTYSRSSYLALIAGTGVILYYTGKLKYLFLLVFIFLLGVLILPRPEGWGVRLERTHSIVLKLEDYNNSIEIIKKSPLFGFGFNNICLVKQQFNLVADTNSHSCSGLDNSYLLIWATSGIVGLVTFADFIVSILKQSSNDFYGKVFLASGAALFVHTLFTNTLFYSWVLIWMMFLLGISRKTISRSGD